VKLLPVPLLSMLPAMAQAQYDYYVNNDGTITITRYFGNGGAVAIPSTFNGLTVTGIGDGAFAQANGNGGTVTSVTIPNSVTSIGGDAFHNDYALTSVTIPNSVTSIGPGAFDASGLASVTIPNSVTTVGDSWFSDDGNLSSVTIPTTITSIQEFAFNGCLSLTSITLPNGVTIIGDYAFARAGLRSVTLPNSLTNIGNFTFENCSGLTAVYFEGNAPSLGGSVFSGDSATVYYLPGTTGWGPTFGGLPAVLWNPQVQTSSATFGLGTNGFGFTVTGTTNLGFIVVEACTDLANPTWSPVGTNTLASGSFYFSDPAWTNFPARFYRLSPP
jgi:hypothetical protein